MAYIWQSEIYIVKNKLNIFHIFGDKYVSRYGEHSHIIEHLPLVREVREFKMNVNVKTFSKH